ncbi:MAG: cardiolipin synthase [Phycisphaeraceae bacterium]|nr:cardiolipin synthase [Phycisphaeraceae bacterium]
MNWLPDWFPTTYFLIDWSIRLALGVLIIIRRRPVSASLAWLALVLFVPVFGIVAYFLVGETRLGAKRLARYEQLTRGIEAEAIRVRQHRHLESTLSHMPYAAVAQFGSNSTGFPPLVGNRLSLINRSEEFLDSLRNDIAEAREHVHILTYIWQQPNESQPGPCERLAEELIKAAERGVACRVLLDAVGSAAFLRSALAARMRRSGVKVVSALPVNPLRALFARIDLRNHRKIAVIDGRTAYVGSQNINDIHFRSKPHRDTGPWIDATLRLSGPAVYALQAIFLRDWLMDADEKIGSVESYVPPIDPLKAAEDDDHCVVQVIPSGPGGAPDAIHQAMLTMIYHAREELVMTTPYFVPDDATRTALQAAATRGVKVTLVMPKVSDSVLVAAASRSHYLDLLESGVRILHYRDGLLHAKTITIDTDLAMIGSANFDQRSFWLNFEVSLFVFDDDFASVVRFMQNDYLNACDEVTLAEWRQRSAWQTLRDNSAQLLGPLL